MNAWSRLRDDWLMPWVLVATRRDLSMYLVSPRLDAVPQCLLARTSCLGHSLHANDCRPAFMRSPTDPPAREAGGGGRGL